MIDPFDFDRIKICFRLTNEGRACLTDGDQEICTDCDQAAAQIVSTLRSKGRLGAPPNTTSTYYRPQDRYVSWRDISNDDPDVNLVLDAAKISCFGQGGAPILAAKHAVATLRSYSRLGELIVGEEARRLFSLLQSTGAINFLNEPIKLKDNRLSRFYIDMRLITSPEDLWRLASLYADSIIDTVGLEGFDTVFGPAYGAIPLAVVTSQILWQKHGARKRHSTMRQETKDYGKGGRLLGPPIAGQRIAMVDDVMTGGLTKLELHKQITQHQGLLVVTVVGVDRTLDPAAISNLADTTGAPVRSIATLTDLAHLRGFTTWEACEASFGRQTSS